MNKKILSYYIICFVITNVFSQGAATKPRIIVFPSKPWMNEHNYITKKDNQGKITTEYDYQRAVETDKQLNSVLIAIEGIMKDRGFPVGNLSQNLSSLGEQNALNNMDQDQFGNGFAESPRDILLKSVKPDIVLEVDWTVIPNGPERSVNFTLAAYDAATNLPVATASGVGPKLNTNDITTLLYDAVNDKIDPFNSRLQTHFDDMFANGRNISLSIKVWANSPKKLNDEINEEGDMLSDDIKKWVVQNTVKGRFNLASSSQNFMEFKEVRIPVFDESGVAFDAAGFATKLRKYIYKTYKLQCESGARGVGIAEVSIGSKR